MYALCQCLVSFSMQETYESRMETDVVDAFIVFGSSILNNQSIPWYYTTWPFDCDFKQYKPLITGKDIRCRNWRHSCALCWCRDQESHKTNTLITTDELHPLVFQGSNNDHKFHMHFRQLPRTGPKTGDRSHVWITGLLKTEQAQSLKSFTENLSGVLSLLSLFLLSLFLLSLFLLSLSLVYYIYGVCVVWL